MAGTEKISINTVKEHKKSIAASNHRGWHKADSIQYWPTQKLINDLNVVSKELFQSHAPSTPIFAHDASIGTMGSCFAMRIREWMKTQNKKAETIFIPEGLNNSFAVKQYIEWVLTGDRSYDAYAYDQNDKQGIFKWESKEEQADTREKFLSFDGYIITYGLSEVWRDKESKGVFWRGVPEDIFDSTKHECVSSTVKENIKNIKETIKLLQEHGPGKPIIITLSPVPLNATYLNRSCIVSDCVSKSILRVAIDESIKNLHDVYYWPSFEFVKWLPAHSGEKTFGGQGELKTLDSRHVSEWAVDKIIENFSNYFFKNTPNV